MGSDVISIGIAVLALLQTAGLFLLRDVRNDIRGLSKDLASHEKRISILEGEHNAFTRMGHSRTVPSHECLSHPLAEGA